MFPLIAEYDHDPAVIRLQLRYSRGQEMSRDVAMRP